MHGLVIRLRRWCPPVAEDDRSRAARQPDCRRPVVVLTVDQQKAHRVLLRHRLERAASAVPKTSLFSIFGFRNRRLRRVLRLGVDLVSRGVISLDEDLPIGERRVVVVATVVLRRIEPMVADGDDACRRTNAPEPLQSSQQVGSEPSDGRRRRLRVRAGNPAEQQPGSRRDLDRGGKRDAGEDRDQSRPQNTHGWCLRILAMQPTIRRRTRRPPMTNVASRTTAICDGCRRRRDDDHERAGPRSSNPRNVAARLDAGNALPMSSQARRKPSAATMHPATYPVS